MCCDINHTSHSLAPWSRLERAGNRAPEVPGSILTPSGWPSRGHTSHIALGCPFSQALHCHLYTLQHYISGLSGLRHIGHRGWKGSLESMSPSDLNLKRNIYRIPLFRESQEPQGEDREAAPVRAGWGTPHSISHGPHGSSQGTPGKSRTRI